MPKPKIRNCVYGKQCSQKWSDLAKTDDPDVKYCSECDKGVHYCHDRKNLAQNIMKNHCVAVSISILDEGYDKPVGTFIGEPSAHYNIQPDYDD
ncbi:hypothetical protein [Thalassotalea sp. Y01]|uniref:hypothetical protein n=1 Tax=Thalassotalea sp. Y01 TaxID=2729613 RepID=UPI00145E118F|nr:hypothetical protein [Thalassotalea sp. Y01]NMP16348.1 hypothetical protein [Thalassotalea sp. Y01]